MSSSSTKDSVYINDSRGDYLFRHKRYFNNGQPASNVSLKPVPYPDEEEAKNFAHEGYLLPPRPDLGVQPISQIYFDGLVGEAWGYPGLDDSIITHAIFENDLNDKLYDDFLSALTIKEDDNPRPKKRVRFTTHYDVIN